MGERVGTMLAAWWGGSKLMAAITSSYATGDSQWGRGWGSMLAAWWGSQEGGDLSPPAMPQEIPMGESGNSDNVGGLVG